MIQKTEILIKDKFFVAGLSVRTRNVDDQAKTDIGSLWGKLMSENSLAQIKGKISDDIYCVYTEYESDQSGWYTVVLGCKIEADQKEKAGDFKVVEIPSGKYEVYTPAGKLPGSIVDVWQSIWRGVADRSYNADFDQYLAGAKSYEETIAKVYLGIN